jgi:CRP/FNR family cyclic AMP-dependent transcriptional regulator
MEHSETSPFVLFASRRPGQTRSFGSIHSLNDYLGKLPWLSEGQRRVLFDQSEMVEIRTGEGFKTTEKSDALYLILSGVAVTSDTGRKAVIDLVGPGEIVGGSCLFRPSNVFQYKALTNCKVATFGVDTWRSIAFGDLSCQGRMMEVTFKRWENLLKRYAQFMLLSTRGRLALVLRELALRFGVKDDRGLLIPFAVSHAMLASMVGASRQHVTIQMLELQCQKFVISAGRQIVVTEQLSSVIARSAVNVHGNGR